MANLTEEEIIALPMEFNLVDGHAYRSWSSQEAALIDHVSEIFNTVDRRDRLAIEQRYLRTFLAAACQSFRPDRFEYHLCFTASMALEAIANLIRARRLSVALVEPCFDNLYDILTRHNIQLERVTEDLMSLSGSALDDRLRLIGSDVLMLVSPNNPTGVTLGKETLQNIIEFCRANDRILVLDTTFRFYIPPAEVYDQYAMLADSGVDCILVEDTGKTWPTLELKAPFFSVSIGLAEQLAHIYSDFILHVSPVSVALLEKFIGLGMTHTREIVDVNRLWLHKAVHGTVLAPTSTPFMSVEWLKVTDDSTSSQWRSRLASAGVHVLTGHRFFWSQTQLGEKYLRVALMRDPSMFLRAATRISECLRANGKN
jgi:aspartate/methionine/tyrosine aminotransferase